MHDAAPREALRAMNGLTGLHPRAYHGRRTRRAGVAQLVEYELPKLGVAGSIPVARSIIRDATGWNDSFAGGAGFTPSGAAKRTRGVSGGEFTSPPRKPRAGGAGDAKSSEARRASTPRVRRGAKRRTSLRWGGPGGCAASTPQLDQEVPWHSSGSRLTASRRSRLRPPPTGRALRRPPPSPVRRRRRA